MNVRRAAIVVSLAAIISTLWRYFLDFRFVPEMAANTPPQVVGSLGPFLAVIALWIWAFVRMVEGSRGWTITNAVLNGLINALFFGIATATAFCPTPCRTIWPLMEITVWTNLLLGAAAAALSVLMVRKAKAAA